jgi:dTDP-4-amino-4,6-dideoxygalactose transaminase
VRCLANHGRSAIERYRHDERGRNSRLDTIQAAALAIKLRRLDEENEARRAAMRRYAQQLPSWCEVVQTHHEAEPVHHLAVVRAPNRAAVGTALTAAHIGWGVHYPVPCHKQPAYGEFNEELPVAEAAAGTIMSLPLSPGMRREEIDQVCDVLAGVRL